jgi:hypothetical protein
MKHFRPHLISRKTKMALYKIPVRPVAAHAYEAWSLTDADEREKELEEYL